MSSSMLVNGVPYTKIVLTTTQQNSLLSVLMGLWKVHRINLFCNHESVRNTQWRRCDASRCWLCILRSFTLITTKIILRHSGSGTFLKMSFWASFHYSGSILSTTLLGALIKLHIYESHSNQCYHMYWLMIVVLVKKTIIAEYSVFFNWKIVSIIMVHD